MNMKKECVNCPGAVDHSTAECPFALAGQRNMENESRAFEAWRNAQVESLRRMGYAEAADAFYNLGSVQWAGWQPRASLPVGVPDVSELQRVLDDVRDVRSADDVAFGWYEAVERVRAPAAPTVKAEQVPTPEFVWVRLLEALAGDNGCSFSASTYDYREVKPSLVQLIAAGFFRDDADSLDGDIWTVAAGEQGEAAARFASCSEAYAVLSDVLNRVFDRPEEGPSLPAAGSAGLTAVRCQCCATEYPHDSYDAGFIAGSGMCQVCDAAMPPKDLPIGEVEIPDIVATFDGLYLVPIKPLQAGEHLMTVAQCIRIQEHLRAALSAQQSAPERVNVPVELVERAVKDEQSWPNLDRNHDCVGCGNWMPKGHREAHEHEEDCEEARAAKARHWRSELRALLASHAEGGKV